jgi:hypothetical protein
MPYSLELPYEKSGCVTGETNVMERICGDTTWKERDPKTGGTEKKKGFGGSWQPQHQY